MASVSAPRTLTSSFLECEPPASVAGGVSASAGGFSVGAGGFSASAGGRFGGDGPHWVPGAGAESVAVVERHTTEYMVVYPAACETREWIATYTVVETCPEKCAARDAEALERFIPPNFVETTVTCDVCALKTQTITCPNALGTESAVIRGDGVTATVEVPAASITFAGSASLSGSIGTLPFSLGEAPASAAPGAALSVSAPSDAPFAAAPSASPFGSAPSGGPFGAAPSGGPAGRPAVAGPPGVAGVNPGASSLPSVVQGARPGAETGSRVLVGTPASTAKTPVYTAAAPHSLNLKQGLVVFTSLSLVVANLFLA